MGWEINNIQLGLKDPLALPFDLINYYSGQGILLT